MKILGIGLIVVALLAPLIWLPAHGQGKDVIALGSQYLGLVSLIAMAFAHLIATRWRGVEAVFGPMDQSYRVHKWLGIGAMVALLLHDTIDAEMKGLGPETLLVEAAETAGEISLYGLLILVTITIAVFIPYHLWKWTHRFIGIFFVAGFLHYLFILKPFKNSDPLGLYMTAICLVGIVAYAYTAAPRGVRPSRPYRITGVSSEGNAVAVQMMPEGKPVRYRAGQFAFFGFTGSGMAEPHPFTISKAPDDTGALRVTIAPLGDLTARLSRALAEGQPVTVEGPYGHFGRPGKTPQVWIAAGVGITPFTALAQSLAPDAAPVTMIYAFRSADEAAHLAELEAIAADKPNLTLVPWASEEKGRLDGEGVASITGKDLSGHRVLFCGPVAMRRALGLALAPFGLTARNYHYEAFEIRTGLGLRRLAIKLIDRI
ncbi:ferredoxin reductase family protein [Actibacterium pelagium]|uniref:FAD-binding FR-type domain-containing protein n=1 Tax=Actibacterium pelagium TaxID=2029103 RepID=A0A917EIC1_9RHOB|nr:ferredoxin reductase family protein [Actibacterium pelagium]GGE47935.1 hypothetical protein GCM10011517_14690 [Actibacterium pelagium]